MFVEVFGPEHHGRVRGYGAGVTPTKLWESEQKRLESEQKRIEADAELKEEVKHLKSMLEQQAIQMAEHKRHFEEQQASQMAKQRAHYDNMMMQMLSHITSQSAQSSNKIIVDLKNCSFSSSSYENRKGSVMVYLPKPPVFANPPSPSPNLPTKTNFPIIVP
ncbi:hypothetical protein CFP56_033672 [Quercus suber]|uniref:Uncharacterized protein n=1 Tax=Quercus suber TaxID=58331 RepID=A0AAW0JF84_QUESU